MRYVALFAAVLFSVSPARAHGPEDRPPDAQQLAELQAKAAAATPRDQPWLYAELVHSMTDIATEQLQEGQVQQASESLRAAQSYANRIHVNLLHDAKRLKNAEILIRHTAFRVREMLMSASLNDRPVLQATLSQLNQVQSEMMMQVFDR